MQRWRADHFHHAGQMEIASARIKRRKMKAPFSADEQSFSRVITDAGEMTWM
jgi:hypothetical protein